MKCIRARYVFAILAAIGFAIIYGLKVNLSVAIVTMVNHTAIEKDLQKSNTSSSHQHDGPFPWEQSKQGLLLSSYFFGYLAGQLPGGYFSEEYSPSMVMLVGGILNIIPCLLTEVACYWNFWAYYALRVVQGFGGGFTFPAMHVLISHWAPTPERSVISTIIYAGTALGTVISTIMSGAIAGTLGWQWVFYIMGFLSIFWCILWAIFVRDSPSQQYFITEEERAYIQGFLGEFPKRRFHSHSHKVPWKEILRSKPFWAILISHLGGNTGWYMILTQLPTYMKQVLHFAIKENALLSSLPYFCMWIFSLCLSQLIDVLRSKNKVTTGTARKICTGIACIGPFFCFIGLGYIGHSQVLGVTLLTISITTIGGMFCGYLANHIDIASHYAGTLMAITNMIATIPGITVPIIVGIVTEDKTPEKWRLVFLTTSGIYAFVFVVYTIWASGEEQEWNKEIT